MFNFTSRFCESTTSLTNFSLEIKVIVNEAIDILVEKIHAIAQASMDPEEQEMLPKFTRKGQLTY